MGNIHQNTFKKIWNGKKYNEFRKKTQLVDCSQLPSVCGQCEHFYEFKRYLEMIETNKGAKKLNLYAFESFIKKEE